MTSPSEKITVKCAKCGIDYPDPWWSSRGLVDTGEEPVREAYTSTCPECNHVVDHEVSIVHEDDGTRTITTVEKTTLDAPCLTLTAYLAVAGLLGAVAYWLLRG